MGSYEIPMVLANEDVSEGVYAASGAANHQSGCQSIYMKGVFQANTRFTNITDWSNDSDVKHKEKERGCEGCPYNWGHCAVKDANANAGQDARPSWEKKGYKDTDPYSFGA